MRCGDQRPEAASEDREVDQDRDAESCCIEAQLSVDEPVVDERSGENRSAAAERISAAVRIELDDWIGGS
jgi:hypothetical protein